MKTSIYTFLNEKWQEENEQGIYMVFMDDRRQAINNAMVDALGGDAMYDKETLERLFLQFSLLN